MALAVSAVCGAQAVSPPVVLPAEKSIVTDGVIREKVTELPDSPSVVQQEQHAAGRTPMLDELEEADEQAAPLPACPAVPPTLPDGSQAAPTPCLDEKKALRTVVNSNQRVPLSAKQKGKLAMRSYFQPFNFLATGFESGLSVATNAHSAYGPGMEGSGRLFGYSLVEDATGDFFGIFLVPAIAHEDPRYRREQSRPFKHRVWHAVSHTVVSEHDDGSKMPNYATLLNYPITAEISNLYIPGVQGNASSTAKRILLGYATDPIGSIIAEFLPDLARRVHVRSLFVQQIINQIAFGNPNGAPQ